LSDAKKLTTTTKCSPSVGPDVNVQSCLHAYYTVANPKAQFARPNNPRYAYQLANQHFSPILRK